MIPLLLTTDYEKTLGVKSASNVWTFNESNYFTALMNLSGENVLPKAVQSSLMQCGESMN